VSDTPRLRPESDRVSSDDLKAEPSADIVIPLLTEELVLEKQSVEKTTVRLTKLVHEQPEIIHEMLRSEHIEVQRVARDEVMATPPAVRVEGDVTVIPVIEEVLIVTKQYRLKEELHITKSHTEREHRQEFSLRSEEVVVTRLDIHKDNQ
jgi:uncharacterized protein (TIGR02271 family)